jgi:phage baseplate assembly protein W
MRKKIVGFSTYDDGSGRRRGFTLYDVEMCKRDLLNHFYTRIGERVMMPTYGCAIWDKVGEPLTPSSRSEIEQECRRIIATDSRVRLQELRIIEQEYGFIVPITLFFEPWDVYESFSLEYDKRQQDII